MTWLLDKLGVTAPVALLLFGLGAGLGYTFSQVTLALGKGTSNSEAIVQIREQTNGLAALLAMWQGQIQNHDDDIEGLQEKIGTMGGQIGILITRLPD